MAVPLTSLIRTTRAYNDDGSPKTAVAFGDVTAAYRVNGGVSVALTTQDITTLGTYQAPTSAAHIRIKKISDSNPHKGELEIHFHNDQLTTGDVLWLSLSLASGNILPLEIDLANLPGRVPNALPDDPDGLVSTTAFEARTLVAADYFVVGDYTAPPSAASIRSEIDSNSTQLAAIVADTNELQVDWANGGRLDLLIDLILADTNELQTDWANGGRLDLLLDATLADTNELQGDWANGGRLDLLLDATLADTNELQGDWVNGGRLDLLIDAILVDTGTTLDGKIDSILADTGTDGVVLSATMLNKIADHVLRRNNDTAEASSDGETLDHRSLYGLIQQLQQSDTTTNAGFLTIFKTDGTTELAQLALATDAAADPVTGVG